MKWVKSKFPGVRYREHATRRHGVKPDKYFSIRYKLNGKDKEEGLGWASQGWNEQGANENLTAIKRRIREGKEIVSLKDKRKQQALKAEGQQTIKQYFENVYLSAQTVKKPATVYVETNYFNNWIDPVIGKKQFQEVSPIDIERLKKKMIQAGKSPRTIEYIFAITRQIWNMARRDKIVSGACPTSEVKKPKINNGRMRFLTPDETRLLLDAVREKSESCFYHCVLAVNCGLRAGEVFNIKWQDVNLEDGTLFIRDAKGGRSRYAFMTDQVKELFSRLAPGAPDDYVFQDRKHGGRIKRVSNVFQRTVKELGFNDGLTDSRNKVVFHTLRHTFASNLAGNGVDLYVIQKLMGHQSFDMVQRYSHLSDASLIKAIDTLNRQATGAEVIEMNGSK